MKIDLHTHCLEATGHLIPDEKVVEDILAAVKAQSLDGIAITDHRHKDFAFKVQEMVKNNFGNGVLIIPGQEIDDHYRHVVELYLSDNYVFRFLAHPGYPSDKWIEYIDDIQGIEVENGGWGVSKENVTEIALQHNLLMLRNSDAHMLDSIGKPHNDIDLEELYSRAIKR